jgi:hypothetical protein
VVFEGGMVVAATLFLPVQPVHGLEEIGGLVVAAALFLPVWLVRRWKKWFLKAGWWWLQLCSYLSGQSMVWKKWFW